MTRDSKALRRKIIDGFSKKDDETGIVYILRHSLYENLYKVGCTGQFMEARTRGFPLCIKEMIEEVHDKGDTGIQARGDPYTDRHGE